MIRDRRGAGIAEYAILLFLILLIGGVTFRVLGGRVKHAGNKTEEQFQGSGNSNGNNPAGANGKNDKTASTAGGANSAGGGGGGAAGPGAGGAGGAGGGKSGGGGGGASPPSQGPNGALAGNGDDGEGTPIWKIMGGVFVVLFLIGGYFAFRKQKKSG